MLIVIQIRDTVENVRNECIFNSALKNYVECQFAAFRDLSGTVKQL